MILFDPYSEPACTGYPDEHDHERCWICNPELLGSRAGLIWIGEQHYDNPGIFMREAARMGISRKIGAIPNGFEIGHHAIFLAHRKCIQVTGPEGRREWQAGVFMAFRPTHVDLVIHDENKVPDKAIEIAKRLGEDKVRLVKVIPDKDDGEEGSWSDMDE
jgi:hypothetical protein